MQDCMITKWNGREEEHERLEYNDQVENDWTNGA